MDISAVQGAPLPSSLSSEVSISMIFTKDADITCQLPPTKLSQTKICLSVYTYAIYCNKFRPGTTNMVHKETAFPSSSTFQLKFINWPDAIQSKWLPREEDVNHLQATMSIDGFCSQLWNLKEHKNKNSKVRRILGQSEPQNSQSHHKLVNTYAKSITRSQRQNTRR